MWPQNRDRNPTSGKNSAGEVSSLKKSGENRGSPLLCSLKKVWADDYLFPILIRRSVRDAMAEQANGLCSLMMLRCGSHGDGLDVIWLLFFWWWCQFHVAVVVVEMNLFLIWLVLKKTSLDVAPLLRQYAYLNPIFLFIKRYPPGIEVGKTL